MMVATISTIALSMKRLVTFIAPVLLLLGSCSRTEQDIPSWDEALRQGGLAAAETSLAAQEQTAETAFLLGGIQFLRAVETILQVRYANYSGALPIIPGMRNRLPINPDATFDPKFFETAMTGALKHLGQAERALETATEGEFAVKVQLNDLWFDIDADGTRDEWEGLIDLMAQLNARHGMSDFDGVIRFDTADAEWLTAYVHLVSGMAELTLSFDPTPAIRRVSEGRAALERAGAIETPRLIGDDTLPETIAAILLAVRGVPDRDRTRAAHAHFKAMIAHQRNFWDKVERETDNDHEWLPNAKQTAAFGVAVDAGTVKAWKDVLTGIEAILDGERLIPYWRVSRRPDADVPIGINIRKLMQNPGDMDLVLWLQGTAAAPFLEQGPLADIAAWRQFQRMTAGDALLFALWFN